MRQIDGIYRQKINILNKFGMYVYINVDTNAKTFMLTCMSTCMSTYMTIYVNIFMDKKNIVSYKCYIDIWHIYTYIFPCERNKFLLFSV